MTVTEEEARSIMKAHGWTYAEHRPKGTAKYVYAQRKRKRQRKQVERYICPLSRLSTLTESELVAKLAPEPAEEKQ